MKNYISNETRNINGVSVKVCATRTLDYDGQWRDGDWEVWYNDRLIGNFVGYPTDEDIKKILK